MEDAVIVLFLMPSNACERVMTQPIFFFSTTTTHCCKTAIALYCHHPQRRSLLLVFDVHSRSLLTLQNFSGWLSLSRGYRNLDIHLMVSGTSSCVLSFFGCQGVEVFQGERVLISVAGSPSFPCFSFLLFTCGKSETRGY